MIQTDGQEILYLVMVPVKLTSIFLKRALEINEGSLQISLVTDLNSATVEDKLTGKIEKIRIFQRTKSLQWFSY